MSSPNLITYEEAGGKPGPLRAALLEEARKHLDEPKVRYMIMGAADRSHDQCDWKNVEISARSRAEAVIAFLDFLNSNYRCVLAGSEPTDEQNCYYVPECLPGETAEDAIYAHVKILQEYYFESECALWLAEWPEETRRASVPELQELTTAARD